MDEVLHVCEQPAAAEWTPPPLFAESEATSTNAVDQSGLIMHLDAMDSQSIGVVDHDDWKVERWHDRVNVGAAVPDQYLQAVSGYRPTYATGVDDLPEIQLAADGALQSSGEHAASTFAGLTVVGLLRTGTIASNGATGKTWWTMGFPASVNVGPFRYGSSFSDCRFRHGMGGNVGTVSGLYVVDNDWHLYTFRLDYTADELREYRGTTLVGTKSLTESPPMFLERRQIGYGLNSVGTAWTGGIREVLAYSESLSDSRLLAVQNSILNKWSV